MIGPPQVINREVKGKKHEPYEVNRNFISVNTLSVYYVPHEVNNNWVHVVQYLVSMDGVGYQMYNK